MPPAVNPIRLPARSQSVRDRIVETPFQFFLEGSENLRVTVWNSLANVTVIIRARFVNGEGALNWQQYTITPTTDRLATTKDFPLGEGVLSTLVVFASGAFPVIGQTFVQASIVVGSQASAPLFGTIVQGYITSRQSLSFPGSIIQSSVEGGGYVRYLVEPAPAAGTLVIITVPTGARWELISYGTVMQTDATVITRRPYFLFGTALATPFLFLDSPETVPAGVVNRYQWVQGLPYETRLAAGPQTTGLPRELPLLAGNTFMMQVDNYQPGDQLGETRYVVREWLEAQ